MCEESRREKEAVRETAIIQHNCGNVRTCLCVEQGELERDRAMESEKDLVCGCEGNGRKCRKKHRYIIIVHAGKYT